MTRRDLIKLLLASAVAEAVDVERLLWTPKPIITVPGHLWTAPSFDQTLTDISMRYMKMHRKIIASMAFNVFQVIGGPDGVGHDLLNR